MKRKNAAVLLAAMALTGMMSVIAFAEDTYTVTFDMNYEGGEDTEQEVKADGRATAPEDPEQEDYAFLGWYTDEERQSRKKESSVYRVPVNRNDAAKKIKKIKNSA